MNAQNEFVKTDDLHSVVAREEQLLKSLPLNEDRFDFQTFVHFADKWASLGKRQRAAALAMSRGSMDMVADLIGPKYLSKEDAAADRLTPAWEEVSDLVFEINWQCADCSDDERHS